MFRTLLSITALTALLGLQSTPATAQTTSRAAARPAAATGAVNINTASAAALEALPGIGAKTAALIVEYRQKNGPFKRIEDLMNIRGIGEKSFLKLRSQVTVATQKADRSASQQ